MTPDAAINGPAASHLNRGVRVVLRTVVGVALLGAACFVYETPQAAMQVMNTLGLKVGRIGTTTLAEAKVEDPPDLSIRVDPFAAPGNGDVGIYVIHIISTDDRSVTVTRVMINGKQMPTLCDSCKPGESHDMSSGEEMVFIFSNPVKVKVDTTFGRADFDVVKR
jgi:hypothetical protein